MRRMTVVLVLVIGLAGCDTAADGGIGTSGPTGAAPGTSTESPELSRAEAAQRYLAAVRPYNEALEEFEDAVNTGQPLATEQELATRTAEALAQEIEDLRTVAWPADVAPHAEALAADGIRMVEEQGAPVAVPTELPASYAFMGHAGSTSVTATRSPRRGCTRLRAPVRRCMSALSPAGLT
jgi:hypothetical protein